ncbi:MAG: hypothetical protein AMXMBFR26_08190 [Porticoccaceae bacterium]
MNVGLVAERAGDCAPLRRALEELGHVVVFCAPPPVAAGDAAAAIDLLIEVAAAPGHCPAPECLRVQLDPEFCAQANAGTRRWRESLRRRIANARWWSAARGDTGRADRVWLLAASAGGPAAVAQFVAAAMPAAGVGLLYAQHIDARQLPQLRRWLAAAGRWQVDVAGSDRFLFEGSLAIIDPECRVRLDRERRLRVQPLPWRGHYRPSIDLVAESLALTYRDRAGMILFSGLGDDGVLGSQHLREHGGEVWVQEPRSCIAGAMPEAVLARGAVDYVGDVAALAQRFNRRCGGAAVEVNA